MQLQYAAQRGAYFSKKCEQQFAPHGGELGSTFLLDSKAHAKIVITLVKRITKNLVAENDNYALAA